ncbi:MAG TPA: hypothetical protein VLY63_05005 [Anaerolineae bacterium]|nr:hypothetical protein [Anaerolineae bacterium]
MAKKSRRARRKPTGMAQPVRISQPSKKLATEAVPQEVDFAVEYHYVIEDLKRIFITALVLLVLLVLLAFLIA